ncbi:hypothetical protein FZEAL_10810, partial [Fusarium zealandicum]
MRTSTFSSGLFLVFPAYALVITSNPCVTTTVLPTITVKREGPNEYLNEYTRVYDEFFSGGLRTKVYTITQTCSSVGCQPPPVDLVPPPGFTCAIVKCGNCGGPGTQTATLTFPTGDINALTSSGYVVLPTEDAASPGSGDFSHKFSGYQDCKGDDCPNPLENDGNGSSTPGSSGGDHGAGGSNYSGQGSSPGMSDTNNPGANGSTGDSAHNEKQGSENQGSQGGGTQSGSSDYQNSDSSGGSSGNQDPMVYGDQNKNSGSTQTKAQSPGTAGSSDNSDDGSLPSDADSSLAGNKSPSSGNDSSS